MYISPSSVLNAQPRPITCIIFRPNHLRNHKIIRKKNSTKVPIILVNNMYIINLNCILYLIIYIYIYQLLLFTEKYAFHRTHTYHCTGYTKSDFAYSFVYPVSNPPYVKLVVVSLAKTKELHKTTVYNAPACHETPRAYLCLHCHASTVMESRFDSLFGKWTLLHQRKNQRSPKRLR